MRRLFALVILIFLLIAVTGCTPEPARSQAVETVPFIRFEETQAFHTLYPSGWEAYILDKGIVLFAPPEVLEDKVPGPSLTVYRDAPADSIETLSVLMDHFLDNGPMRADYLLTSSIQNTEVNGVQGLMVDFESTDPGDQIKGRIEMVRLDNQAVYYFIASAPHDVWDQEWFYLEQIIHQSVFIEN